MHSLRVQADALFASAPTAPQWPWQGPYRLFYDVPLSKGEEQGGKKWGKSDLAVVRCRMPHVPLASLLRLVAEGAE